MKRSAILCACVLALVALGLSITGCTNPGPTFVNSKASYSKATALGLLAATDTSKIADRPTSDADSLRHAALTDLRRRGTAASAAADLLTKTFPRNANGVPVYVEQGSFGTIPATILVEATGPATGKLSTKRLWVIGNDGTVLFVATR